MLEFLETLGFIAVLIIIALVILVIALIKAIFEMRDHLENLDNTLTAIAKKQHGIQTLNNIDEIINENEKDNYINLH